MPIYRNLWEHIRKDMPKLGRAKGGKGNPLALPSELQTALYALYGHYEKTFDQWDRAGIEVPPVFIVVCNNTSTSELVYEWISGFERDGEDEQNHFIDGHLKLFRNYDEHGARLARANTLLIDSEQVAMRTGIRRRDLFAAPSLRYADPRIGLLDGQAWEAARPSICRTLGLSTDAPAEVSRLAERLDAAYRDTAANLPKNAAVQVDGAELVLSALDKLDEPPSLVALKAAVAARLPRVDLPELLLEMHTRTGFAGGFTHASEDGARAGDVATSICAVLVAEACNTGFEPLIRRDNPALRRSRLSWVRQNYIRAETLTRSNATLVAAQNRILLARAWGGGDVASADGVRFVVPVRTIHSGPNPRYFGQERGVTFYNLVSDQFTGLNGITVPGTLRDSLTLLSVVLEQQTELQPTEIMSDTAPIRTRSSVFSTSSVTSSVLAWPTSAAPGSGAWMAKPIMAHWTSWPASASTSR